MSQHPAYPTRHDLRIERQTDEQTATIIGANAMVADILAGTLAKLRAMRLDDVTCMAPGWDWPSMMNALSDMIPAVDDAKARRAVGDAVREAMS